MRVCVVIPFIDWKDRRFGIVGIVGLGLPSARRLSVLYPLFAPDSKKIEKLLWMPPTLCADEHETRQCSLNILYGSAAVTNEHNNARKHTVPPPAFQPPPPLPAPPPPIMPHTQTQTVTGHKCRHPGYEEFNPPSWPGECAPNKEDWITLEPEYCGDKEWIYAEEFWGCADFSIMAGGKQADMLCGTCTCCTLRYVGTI